MCESETGKNPPRRDEETPDREELRYKDEKENDEQEIELILN